MRRRNKVGEAGANQRRETANVSDLMASEVVTARPDEPVGVLRERMAQHGIHALPVVDGEQVPLGIVTASDLLADLADETPVAKIMTHEVMTIPAYSRVHEAARAMLNQRIHHLVVTHEKQVVGILSSFDILHLVAERRFTMKSAAPRD
jgi:CBS domain-containing protein